MCEDCSNKNENYCRKSKKKIGESVEFGHHAKKVIKPLRELNLLLILPKFIKMYRAVVEEKESMQL